MIRVERDKVTFYQFLGLRDFPGLIHFVSGREGGVSVGGQAALNLGFMDEDRDDRVLTNRMSLAEAVGCGVDDFILGEQKHTTHVEVVTRSQRGRGGPGESDSLIFDRCFDYERNGSLSDGACCRLCSCFDVRSPGTGYCCCSCGMARYGGKNYSEDRRADAGGIWM